MNQSPLRTVHVLVLAACCCFASAGAFAAPGKDGSSAGGAAATAPPAHLPDKAADGPKGAPSPAAAAPALEGSSWLLAAYRAGNALVEITATPAPAPFRFEGGRVTGNAGCNQIGGGYTLDGDRLSFKANMASTLMACPEPLMKQDQAVGAALAKVAAWRLDGELLELLDAAGRPLLRLLHLKSAPLVGQVWQLEGLDNGKQGIASALSGTEISLEFRDDGTLGGWDGCNRYMSGYTLKGESLTIGPLATTRMACKGPSGAVEQARDYAAALGTVTDYRIDGGTLTLRNAAGTPAARYRAEEVRPVELAAPALPAGEGAPPPPPGR